MEDLSFKCPDAVLETELVRSVELGLEPSRGIGCYVQSTPSSSERWHYHEEYELQLVVQTSGLAYVGANAGRFKPGSVILIGPRIPHNLVSLDVPPEGVRERSIVIHFDKDLMRRAEALFPELQSTVALLERDRCGIEFLEAGRDLQGAFQRIRQSSGVARFSALVELLQRLARWSESRVLSSIPRAGGRHSDGRDRRIDKVLELVYQSHSESLSLARASHCAGVGTHTFSRLFRRVTGSTYTDFLIGVRVTKACELLSRSDAQISSICYLVGFNNISNFNRHFRRLKGMTPKEYRILMSGRFKGAVPEPGA